MAIKHKYTINYINKNTWIYHKNEIKTQTSQEQIIINPKLD